MVLSTFTWAGDAGDSWTDIGAWSVDGSPSTGIPGAGDDVVFDDSSLESVATPGAATTVRSLTISSGYTGSLSLGGDFKANYGFIQEGGTFNAGSHTLTIGRDLSVDAGTFNAGNSSVVMFPGPIGASSKVDAAGVALHNFTIDQGSHHFTVLNTLDVNGTLTLKGFNSLNGTIHAGGNVVSSAGSGNKGNQGPNDGKIVIDGSGAQSLQSADPEVHNGFLPSIEVAKSGGTLSLIGGLVVDGNWTYSSGGVNAGSSTVKFVGGTNTVDTGNHSLNNVIIDTGSHHFFVKKLDVNGDFTIQTATNIRLASGATAGNLTVAGSLTSLDSTVSGDASIVMDGGGHVALKGPGDFPNGGHFINKGVYNVTVSGMETPLDNTLTIESLANLNGDDLLVGKDVITKDSSVGGSGYIVFAGTGNQKLIA